MDAKKESGSASFFHDLPLMALGTALVSIGVYFFKFPNHFSTGGVSGLSILMGQIISFATPAIMNTILNVLFLALGFLVMNRGFGLRTVCCTLLYTGLIQALEWLCPLDGPLTDQKMLELFFSVILPALGAAILFNLSASTGGTDILAMVLRKYTGLDAGLALLLSDVLIAASALLVFDVETGLFSLLGLLFKSLVVDSVIESLNRKKSFMVVTHDPEPVRKYINETIHRGATLWKGEGAYTGKEQTIILTALSPHQAMQLRNYLRQHDTHAFMLITNSSEIFGKGFLTP